MSGTNTLLGPDLLLRQYAWEILKLNDPVTWDETKYGGSIPITPLADEPELSGYDGPHIVYGYTVNTGGSLFADKSGTMTFAIYDENFRRLGQTINILSAAFERADESARDVNKFTSLWEVNSQKVFLGVRFGCIEMGFVQGGTPEIQEGGRQSGLLNIRYDYFVQYDVQTDVYSESTV